MAPAGFRIHDPSLWSPLAPTAGRQRLESAGWAVRSSPADVAPIYIEGYDRSFLQAPKKSQEKVLSKANAQNKFGDSRNREILDLE